MSLDNKDLIERIMKKGKKTAFLLIEHREWNKIENADTKLWNKIEYAKNYSKSNEATIKFGDSIEIILACKHKPPENILSILKAQDVKLKVI
ncbi:MAG: hypothetical protein HY515_04005 [Candidatus Aenigmarchaeota archaeon]|nr:hypothetical protein [Candidatus Aenigmarchaeota archaeon]